MNKNVRDAGSGRRVVFVCRMKRIARGTRHAREPERNPEKTESAEREEIRAPAVTLHQRAAQKQTKCGAGTDSGVNEGIDEAAMPHRKMAHDDTGKTRVGGGFSDAKKEPAEEERSESAGKTREKSGSRPDGETDGEDFSRRETIGEPAGKNEEGSVRPEKSREKKAELGRRDGKLVFESWRGDGESAAVNVGNEEGEKEKDEDGPESGREFFGWRGRVQGAEIVQQPDERKKQIPNSLRKEREGIRNDIIGILENSGCARGAGYTAKAASFSIQGL